MSLLFPRVSVKANNVEPMEFLGCLATWLMWGFVMAILFTFWTDRSLDFWVSYFKGHPVNVPIWISFLVTLIGNGFVLVGNVISELLRIIVKL